MREFILRAQKARTSDINLADLPENGRLDLVCRCISNALFISNDLRRDTIIHVVFEGPAFPAVMQSAGQQCIHKVIAAGDGIEI